VRTQLRSLQAGGHEIALHVHPWWTNAQREDGNWRMDWNERNLCVLAPERVEEIISRGIGYLRDALEDPRFTPCAFRSGLWAMQPTAVVADVLARHGVRVDSSVFKGGRVHALGLDYRPSARNSAAWRFGVDVNVPDPSGPLWELPIHTDMVPFWKMLGRKRLTIHSRAPEATEGTSPHRGWRDYLRFRYPRKLDFCRMTFPEMREAVEGVLADGEARQVEPGPIVAIGHSKDLVEFDAIQRFMDFIGLNAVTVTTFSHFLARHGGLVS
jgi:hypothetical protein